MAIKVTIVRVLASVFLALSCGSSSLVIASAADDEAYGVYGRTLDPKKLLGMKKEKLLNFKLYWHDIFSAEKPTSIPMVKPLNGSQTFFGEVNVIDNPLTLGPGLSSKLVGRAQGVYAMVDQEEFGAFMAMSFYLLEGKYNGSTITLVGRNSAASTMREVSVVGGSGLFRFAHGYAKLQTHTYDTKSGNAIVEYDIYVFYF